MSSPSPLYCRPEAFAALAHELEAIDTTRGLIRCAVAVSMHQLPDVDADEVEARLQSLADDVSERLISDDPRAILAHAHAVLFDEARFSGNTDDYYNPRNSYLSQVLDHCEGLPITLTMVYKSVLEALGLRVVGVNAPGHFLAGVLGEGPNAGFEVGRPGVAMVVDPFHSGRVLNREEALRLIDQVAGGHLPHDDTLLHPATHAQWLTRLIQNLIACFDRLGKRDDMHAMLELRAMVESVA